MFVKRLLSGIVLIFGLGFSFAIGGYLLSAVLMIISLIGYCELVKALCSETERRELNGPDNIAFASIILYYLSVTFTDDRTFLILVIGGFMLLELVWFVLRFPKYSTDRIVRTVFSVLYCPVMLSFIYMIRELEGREFLIWIVLITSWGCDTLAYCSGMLLGRHHPFKQLSPKKSTEGCIGGIIGSAAIGLLFGIFYVKRFLPVPYVEWRLALICGVGALMGMVGDLAASGIKRNNNIKDFGKLIPGHGGIMDRFDSMILCAPAAYILTYLLITVS
ncbi:MAG: phosphatidate cytidylyltransferase [Lachnospiraceae bacterium]|jgi:phosphatidate cytidylyltransferase|nr:phosphatidate cytidylyltransferase [Lachnospiraceae bacterium]